MIKSAKKDLYFFTLFQRFIHESKRGKRLQPNGKRISAGTVKNYIYTHQVLNKFCTQKAFPLRLRQERYLNKREAGREQNYWKKFYKLFTDYLYKDCGYYDNYVGQNIKIIKTFFNYLNKDLALGVGSFHKLFYVRKEEISIFPLMPEELNFLIYNQAFESSLPSRLREVKDVFVFGCTVALRISDLLKLKKANLRIINENYYLSVRSQKTNIDTLMKLPDYAVQLLMKYHLSNGRILPSFNKTALNKYIKVLLEKAGFTHQVRVFRERRGRPVEVRKKMNSCSFYRFCDVATTHTMRRTAITTMLCLGMSEEIVRKISGHTPQSKEFYRYVLWSQTYLDAETDKVFSKLKEKEMKG